MSIQKASSLINILTRNTIGLTVDTRILKNTLTQAGVNANVYFPRGRNIDLLSTRVKLHIYNNLNFCKKISSNIFIEQIMPGWLNLSRANFLIPNQEWCRPETIDLLNRVNFILCKTKYAERIFEDLGHRVAYIGWTSEDRFINNIPKDYNKFLHVAGRSVQKGTETLSKLWARHPEWPILTIVTKQPQLVHGKGAKNIQVCTDVLTDQSMVVLQNECGIHLCPSEAEGFGHYIVEALGCGAVVVTTDAPPMNELVTNERGFLVAYAKTSTQSLGSNFYVDTDALEASIETIIKLSIPDKVALGKAGRSWFIDNKLSFETRLPVVIRDLEGIS